MGEIAVRTRSRFRFLWTTTLMLSPWVVGAAGAQPADLSLSGSVPADYLVRIADADTANAVTRSLGEAHRQLASSSCRKVFTDFSDARGGTLQGRLDRHRVTAQDYLRLVFFHDGDQYRQCRKRPIIAFTAVGSRVVFVCNAAFRSLYQESPGHAAGILIHEMLHSLGLEENPPTSRAITAQVSQRCGTGTLMVRR